MKAQSVPAKEAAKPEAAPKHEELKAASEEAPVVAAESAAAPKTAIVEGDEVCEAKAD